MAPRGPGPILGEDFPNRRWKERVDRIDPHLVEAATFADGLHAKLAAGYLADWDIPALIQAAGIDDPFRAAGASAPVRLLVPVDRLDEAQALLSVPIWEPDQEPLELMVHRRPSWVYPVALLLLIGMVIAAVPGLIRIPALATALVGYVVWRKIRSR